MELYIVRHGQSQANVGMPILDAHLTQLGLRQADLLGQEFADIHFDRILASTLARTAQTAAGIAAYQSPDTVIELVPELVEADTPADFEGDRAFLQSVYPRVRADRMQACAFDDDHARARYVLEEYVFGPAYAQGFDVERSDREGIVMRERQQNLLIVTHCVFIAHLLSHLVGFPFDPNMVVSLSNTGVSRLALYTINGMRRIKFKSFNETRHLPKDALSS
ncbi:MAG: histidine phosphatase family protein [Clostridia bacterium]|nr:histidine phosphatase family protein [Clostridia bacterium]